MDGDPRITSIIVTLGIKNNKQTVKLSAVLDWTAQFITMPYQNVKSNIFSHLTSKIIDVRNSANDLMFFIFTYYELQC